MIQEARLNTIASYTNPVIIRPQKINFFYGSNGSGKTTLANILGGRVSSSDCTVIWENGIVMPVLVYNRQFVEENFESRIGGIFTLGKDSRDAQEFIEQQTQEIKKCDDEIESDYRSLKKLNSDRNKINLDFDDACWVIEQNYGSKFSEALIGYRKSKNAFSTKCLDVHNNKDDKNVLSLQEIERLYDAAFGKKKCEYLVISKIDATTIAENEDCRLLAQKITGSSDTPIGYFIEYLNNSDWVKRGLEYAQSSAGKCPFCQQNFPEDVKYNIEAFFDEKYEENCNALKLFKDKYNTYNNSLVCMLRNMVGTIPILSYEQFTSEVSSLESLHIANQKMIDEKIASPAITVTIKSISSHIEKLNQIIDVFNEIITRNNDVARNQKEEQENCKEAIWTFFEHESRETIRQYIEKDSGLKKGIRTLDAKITELKKKRDEHKRLVDEKEETLTSVAPTVNAINNILERFGFTGFSLEENQKEKGTYRIVRPDGSNAQNTLSEGEYNFISFLYFYHLVYGSQKKIGITENKVIIIDDPISSLDSNVLFIISTLVRALINSCKNDVYGVKQIFILTHNVYFHKEITYISNIKQWPSEKTLYWVVKKINNSTEIVAFPNNPIQTSYELLWYELRDVDRQQRVTIFNTMRRILEYYFNIIGGMNYEECIGTFDGEDKIVCKSLISCINDGSHFISEDFVMCFESDTLQKYISVFELIFRKMGHGSHYDMMMKASEAHSLREVVT